MSRTAKSSRRVVEGIVCALLILLAAPTQMAAQKSDKATKRAASWFRNTTSGDKARENFTARLSALQAADITLWKAATEKARIAATTQDLVFTLTDFTPLWSPTNQPVNGAMAKYAKRIEQISTKVIEQWESLTGADSIHAALSLTAEAELFPQKKFSDQAFQVLVVKFK